VFYLFEREVAGFILLAQNFFRILNAGHGNGLPAYQ
jgi:hypothetical protein